MFSLKHRAITACIIAAIGILFAGCADSATGVDKVAPVITLYGPVSNDTLGLGTYEVTYDISDDQGIKNVDLFVNSNFYKRFTPTLYANHPIVMLTVDSSMVGSTISIALVAYDLSGNSTTSSANTNIAIVYSKNPPSAPANLKVRRISSSIVNLYWTVPNYADAIEVYRKSGSTGTYTLFKTLPGNSFNTNDPTVDPATQYNYKLRATNRFGSSAYSNEAFIAGAFGNPNLPAPTLLSVQNLGTRQNLLTWLDNSSNENFFRVERKFESGDFTSVVVLPPNSRSFKDSATVGLMANQTYTYRVKVYTDSDSSWSNEISVTNSSYDLARPTNVVLLQVSATKLKVSWRDNTVYETGYIVERKIGINGNYQVLTSAAGIEYLDSTFTPGFANYYRVRATDGVIFSEYSDEVFITPTAHPVTRVNGVMKEK